MMGSRQVEQGALFYNFSLNDHVPADNLLRSVDPFVDLAGLPRELAPYYSGTARPSVDPEFFNGIRPNRTFLSVPFAPRADIDSAG